MSYDPTLLYERIFLILRQNPSLSLEELSGHLHVSRRTIQNIIIAVAGKKFRDLREEFLLARFKTALAAEPAATIKELSSEIGYRSARFRACNPAGLWHLPSAASVHPRWRASRIP